MTTDPKAIRKAIDQELDTAYFQATTQALGSVAKLFSTGVMATRLQQLQDEATRKAALGQPLSPDDPAIVALLADMRSVLRQAGRQIDNVSSDVVASAINASISLAAQTTTTGLPQDAAEKVRAEWLVLDPTYVANAINYTNSPDWADALGIFDQSILQRIRDMVIRGIVQGQGPATTASQVSKAVQSLPTYQANMLLRTLQLTSFRDADVVNRVANAGIVQSQIRIAVLDDRTCMACVALNGTELPIDERIDDHYNGRCTSISVVKGFPRQVQSGADWFDKLSPARQAQQMGQAAFDAWQAGKIQLSDFVHHTDDPLFGGMIQEQSLKGMLGEAAKDFYKTKSN